MRTHLICGLKYKNGQTVIADSMSELATKTGIDIHSISSWINGHSRGYLSPIYNGGIESFTRDGVNFFIPTMRTNNNTLTESSLEPLRDFFDSYKQDIIDSIVEKLKEELK